VAAGAAATGAGAVWGAGFAGAAARARVAGCGALASPAGGRKVIGPLAGAREMAAVPGGGRNTMRSGPTGPSGVDAVGGVSRAPRSTETPSPDCAAAIPEAATTAASTLIARRVMDRTRTPRISDMSCSSLGKLPSPERFSCQH
jgi:hypothetical protein